MTNGKRQKMSLLPKDATTAMPKEFDGEIVDAWVSLSDFGDSTGKKGYGVFVSIQYASEDINIPVQTLLVGGSRYVGFSLDGETEIEIDPKGWAKQRGRYVHGKARDSSEIITYTTHAIEAGAPEEVFAEGDAYALIGLKGSFETIDNPWNDYNILVPVTIGEGGGAAKVEVDDDEIAVAVASALDGGPLAKRLLLKAVTKANPEMDETMLMQNIMGGDFLKTNGFVVSARQIVSIEASLDATAADSG